MRTKVWLLGLLISVVMFCAFWDFAVAEGYSRPKDTIVAIHIVVNDVLISFGFNVLDATVSETGIHQFRVAHRENGEEFVLSGTASVRSISPLSTAISRLEDIPPRQTTSSNVEELEITLMDQTEALSIRIIRTLETAKNGEEVGSRLHATLTRDGIVLPDGVIEEEITTRIVGGDTTIDNVFGYLANAEVGDSIELESQILKARGSDRRYIFRWEKATKKTDTVLVSESETQTVDPDAFVVTKVTERWTSCVGDCANSTLPELSSYQLAVTYYGFDLSSWTPVSSTTEYSLAEVPVERLVDNRDRTILQTVYVLEDPNSGDRLSFEGTVETTIIGNQVKKAIEQAVWRNKERIHSETVLSAVDPLPVVLVLAVSYLTMFCAEFPQVCASVIFHGGRFLLEQGMLAYGRFIGAEEAGDPTRTCDVKADILTCRGPEAMDALRRNYSLDLRLGGEAVLKARTVPVIETSVKPCDACVTLPSGTLITIRGSFNGTAPQPGSAIGSTTGVVIITLGGTQTSLAATIGFVCNPHPRSGTGDGSISISASGSFPGIGYVEINAEMAGGGPVNYGSHPSAVGINLSGTLSGHIKLGSRRLPISGGAKADVTIGSAGPGMYSVSGTFSFSGTVTTD